MRVRQIQPKLRDFNKAGLMAYLLFFAAAKRHGLGFAVIFTVQGKKHDAIIDRDTDLIFLAPNPRFQIIIADTDNQYCMMLGVYERNPPDEAQIPVFIAIFVNIAHFMPKYACLGDCPPVPV